jgi:hypothetical protein
MVEIKDSVIIDRENEFIADEISFLNFVVSDYSNPKNQDPAIIAETEYDDFTKKGINELIDSLGKEADAKKLVDILSRDKYVRERLNQIKKERKNGKEVNLNINPLTK